MFDLFPSEDSPDTARTGSLFQPPPSCACTETVPLSMVECNGMYYQFPLKKLQRNWEHLHREETYIYLYTCVYNIYIYIIYIYIVTFQDIKTTSYHFNLCVKTLSVACVRFLDAWTCWTQTTELPLGCGPSHIETSAGGNGGNSPIPSPKNTQHPLRNMVSLGILGGV